jgi:phosphoglycolate phosphatase
MIHPSPVLVLDLDGTLIDTVGDLTKTLNDVLRSEGIGPMPLAEARLLVGHGARAMIASALQSAGITAESERLDNLFALFLDIYAGRIAEESRPFPGAIESLDRFAADGWLIAICTNKLERHSRLLLEALGIADRFAVIAGQDTYGVRKPDPRHLLETVRESGGDSASAIMVGDSEVDIQTAKAANVPVVAVDFGYSRIPVADLGPDRVISHFVDLYDAARSLVGRTATA